MPKSARPVGATGFTTPAGDSGNPLAGLGRKLARRLTCPYCYEVFTAQEIEFRCHTRLSRARRRCASLRDPILEERFGTTAELGPTFRADGRRRSAVCPECEGETTFRICPVCHSGLPAQFGMVDNRLIAMVGSRDSGKTVLMTVLLHEVMHRTGAGLGAALMGGDDSTMARFTKDYHDVLYKRRKMLPTTSSAGAVTHNRVDPLVFRFSMTRRGPLRARPQHTVLSFFDTAGEDFNSRESVELNTRYLANADGVLLVLDPLQMPGARELARPGTTLPDVGRNDPAQHVLNRITSMLLSHTPGRRAARIRVPMAVVFTKMDAFWPLLDEGSPLRSAPEPTGSFDTADSLNAHEEVRGLLRQWNETGLDQALEANYRTFRYFGTSALGASPTTDREVAATGIQPLRVADPLLWLLSEFGSVPKRSGG
jgi:hypothetical protein